MASMYHYMFVMRPAMTVRQAELDRVWRDVDMIKLNNKAAKAAKTQTFRLWLFLSRRIVCFFAALAAFFISKSSIDEVVRAL